MKSSYEKFFQMDENIRRQLADVSKQIHECIDSAAQYTNSLITCVEGDINDMVKMNMIGKYQGYEVYLIKEMDLLKEYALGRLAPDTLYVNTADGWVIMNGYIVGKFDGKKMSVGLLGEKNRTQVDVFYGSKLDKLRGTVISKRETVDALANKYKVTYRDRSAVEAVNEKAEVDVVNGIDAAMNETAEKLDQLSAQNILDNINEFQWPESPKFN